MGLRGGKSGLGALTDHLASTLLLQAGLCRSGGFLASAGHAWDQRPWQSTLTLGYFQGVALLTNNKEALRLDPREPQGKSFSVRQGLYYEGEPCPWLTSTKIFARAMVRGGKAPMVLNDRG
jgi:hypothetical protein